MSAIGAKRSLRMSRNRRGERPDVEVYPDRQSYPRMTAIDPKRTKRRTQNRRAQRTGVQISVWPSRGTRAKARMRRLPSFSIDICVR